MENFRKLSNTTRGRECQSENARAAGARMPGRECQAEMPEPRGIADRRKFPRIQLSSVALQLQTIHIDRQFISRMENFRKFSNTTRGRECQSENARAPEAKMPERECQSPGGENARATLLGENAERECQSENARAERARMPGRGCQSENARAPEARMPERDFQSRGGEDARATLLGENAERE
eukprot:gene15028-biopygen11363